MQNEYTLYNFDHGFEKEKTLRIGKYCISVSEEQANNINKLEWNTIRSFVMGDDLSRKVEELAKRSGELVETATLKVFEADITPSLIYREMPDRNSVDDFVLFLSFITGRRVFLEHDLKQEISIKYFDSVVDVSP